MRKVAQEGEDMNPERDSITLIDVLSGVVCLFGIFAFFYLFMVAI